MIRQTYLTCCGSAGNHAPRSNPQHENSGYHPQTNWQAKRANQALEATLRCVTTSNPASWSLHLPWGEYSLNTMVSSATGLSPFQCSLGYQPPLFHSQETEAAVPSIQAHLRQCRRVWKVARDSLLQFRDRVQRVANRRRVPAPAYRPGQRVWLLAKDLPLRGRGFHYLVDWVGYGPVDRTWVPRSYFADPALLGDFYRANPRAIGQSPGVSRREGGPVAGALVTTPPDQIINQP